MRLFLLITLLLFVVFLAKSQTEKGAFLAEGGVQLYGTLPSTDGFGVWFGFHDIFNEDFYQSGTDHFSYGNRNFGFSLAPRFGYTLFRNFVIGTDLKYFRSNSIYSPYKDEDKVYDEAYGYGFFIRKYFGVKKFTPFVDFDFGFWDSEHFEHSYSPGGGLYDYTENHNFGFYGGAIGYSYGITEKFRLNLMAKFQHTKSTTSNSSITRELYFDSSMFLSVSYFLNPKSNQ